MAHSSVRDVDVVDDEGASLPGYTRLTRAMVCVKLCPPHGLVHVDGGREGDVEAYKPHVHDNGVLRRVAVALEVRSISALWFLPLTTSNHSSGVLSARSHDHAHLVGSLRTKVHE